MRSRFLLTCLLAAAIACRDAQEPEQITVAYLGDEPQTLADLQRYLETNLLNGEGEARLSPDEMYEVKSRVFDAFVNERLLLREAVRRGVDVTDLEIEAYLGLGREQEEAAISASRWAEARSRLMIQKLQEGVALDLPPIQEREVLEFLERNRESWTPERRLRIRTLMLPASEAERVHGEIKRRRMTFNEAVIAHETSEGQGVPLEVSWESLSQEMREALQGLKAGQVSRPVSLNGEIYLFRVDAWLDEPAAEQELQRMARERLERERREEAFAGLLRRLQREIRVTMKPENLPFEYIPEGTSGDESG